MTDTLTGKSPPRTAGAGDAEERDPSPLTGAVEDLVRQARAAGIALIGRDWWYKAMTKTVSRPRSGRDRDHLGYDNAVEGRNRANCRIGTRSKVRTDSCGEVSIEVPHDPGRQLVRSW